MKRLSGIILDVFGEAYLVGGALRDAVLKKSFKDIDLAVPPGPHFRSKTLKLARKLNAACFPLDEENLVYRLKTRKTPFLQLDIAPFQGRDLDADLGRRDFTVNAMALPLERALQFALDKRSGALRLPRIDRKKIIDPLGGLGDASKKELKAAGPGAFKEDPLRTLRAFRLAAALGFKITPSTFHELKRRARLINKSAPERVHDELLLLLENERSSYWLDLMHKAGLLTAIFPDLAPQETCAEIYYGRGGVLKHTLRVVERMDYLFAHLPAAVPEYKKIEEFFRKPAVMKLAALLHDIAKPPKAAVFKGRLRFFGHEEHGALMCERLMADLRFSREDTRLVSNIVGRHLRPGNLASNAIISDRAIFRFFRMMGEYTVPLLALSWADHASYITQPTLVKVMGKIKENPLPIPSGGLPYNGLKKTLRFLQVLNLLFKVYVKKNIKLRTARLIDGHDVIRVLKIKEGPRVGEILEKTQLLQFEGKIKNRHQALRALRKMPGA
ncbi:MAG: HD domain-containing protein [Elusimicrobia bacterium]|nr:HD domain-containing protein [Elusimicrobiota bacterium]